MWRKGVELLLFSCFRQTGIVRELFTGDWMHDTPFFADFSVPIMWKFHVWKCSQCVITDSGAIKTVPYTKESLSDTLVLTESSLYYVFWSESKAKRWMQAVWWYSLHQPKIVFRPEWALFLRHKYCNEMNCTSRSAPLADKQAELVPQGLPFFEYFNLFLFSSLACQKWPLVTSMTWKSIIKEW